MPYTHGHHEQERTASRKQHELTLRSPAFQDGGRIDGHFTADGRNVSPPLAWAEPPPNTKSFAIVCEDPDATSGLFIHWVIWNLDGSTRTLDEAVPATGDLYGVRQGRNGFGGTGYGGPKPPRGKPHRYVFRLCALDTMLDLNADAGWREFSHAIEGHVLATATLTGTYGR